jgi:hypothetical protein
MNAEFSPNFFSLLFISCGGLVREGTLSNGNQ